MKEDRIMSGLQRLVSACAFWVKCSSSSRGPLSCQVVVDPLQCDRLALIDALDPIPAAPNLFLEQQVSELTKGARNQWAGPLAKSASRTSPLPPSLTIANELFAIIRVLFAKDRVTMKVDLHCRSDCRHSHCFELFRLAVKYCP